MKKGTPMNKTKQYEKDCTKRNKRTFNFLCEFLNARAIKKGSSSISMAPHN